MDIVIFFSKTGKTRCFSGAAGRMPGESREHSAEGGREALNLGLAAAPTAPAPRASEKDAKNARGAKKKKLCAYY